MVLQTMECSFTALRGYRGWVACEVRCGRWVRSVANGCDKPMTLQPCDLAHLMLTAYPTIPTSQLGTAPAKTPRTNPHNAHTLPKVRDTWRDDLDDRAICRPQTRTGGGTMEPRAGCGEVPAGTSSSQL
jgi:hypothetical protein